VADISKYVLIVGGSGGIGRALISELLTRYPETQIGASYYQGQSKVEHERLSWQVLDVRDSSAIDSWASDYKRVDWIVNAIGYLHGPYGGPEKSIRSPNPDFLLENIRINTLPTLMLAKSFAAGLKQSPAPLLATLSARVGSIEDNRLGGWYSYRISKAALNMALKTLSVEWKHSHPRGCVAALHPGTNDTALSRNLFRQTWLLMPCSTRSIRRPCSSTCCRNSGLPIAVTSGRGMARCCPGNNHSSQLSKEIT
jgi:NAD(P)-dependent dehydrogenase (short-subunit alcohol dehydrogenase family)